MKNKNMLGLIIIVVIAVAIGGLKLSQKDKTNSLDTSSTSASVTSDQPGTSASGSTTASTKLKDGTYTANGTYQSPGGNESIDVTVTLKDSKIVSSSAEPQAASRESMEFQDEFVSNYKKHVIGKDIASLKLSKVSGSSLTSQGFNQAIEKIKSQAQS